MDRDKSERRKSPRANANIVIRYHILEESRDYDLSQSMNVSQDGLLLTTNRMFHPGTRLAMNAFFPFLNAAIEITGDVVESREVMEDLIYETHIHFHDLEKKMREQLAGFVEKLAA
ncbi:PilZ domain-containing protein [Thermodesulfobacteriota bacterium]